MFIAIETELWNKQAIELFVIYFKNVDLLVRFSNLHRLFASKLAFEIGARSVGVHVAKVIYAISPNRDSYTLFFFFFYLQQWVYCAIFFTFKKASRSISSISPRQSFIFKCWWRIYCTFLYNRITQQKWKLTYLTVNEHTYTHLFGDGTLSKRPNINFNAYWNQMKPHSSGRYRILKIPVQN